MARMPTIPYPSSPPPAVPPQLSGQQSHLLVDSTDVPPLPSTGARERSAPDYQEMGNPWADESNSSADRSHTIPSLLKPGVPQEQTSSHYNLPDVLRPGWSGEATPRSSSESNRSHEKEWWDDDDVEERTADNKMQAQAQASPQPGTLHVVNDTAPVSPSSQIKRKPLPQDKVQPQLESPKAFSSNNPFRLPSETHLNPSADLAGADIESKSMTRSDHPNPLRSHPSADHLGRLTLESSGYTEPESIAAPTFPPPPPPQHDPPPLPQLAPPVVPEMPSIVSDGQTSLEDEPSNPWEPVSSAKVTPLPSPNAFPSSKRYQTVSTDNLLQTEQHSGHVALGDELKALPNAAPSPWANFEDNLMEDEPTPSLPPRPVQKDTQELYAPDAEFSTNAKPPMKPPRPAVVTSEQDLARMREQRNETYSIKHFNWYDPRSSRMRRSSMLVQNKNGPCPLLALVNALILGATEDMQAALDDALRLREQVSLGLIIETLVDELITRASTIEGLVVPDVDELNRFLMRLRTGMNANPRFVPPKAPAPNLMDADSPVNSGPPQQPHHGAGTFENTEDIKLYSSFKVKLIHGWLPRPNDQAARAFGRSAQTYEDAQAIQFGEEELEYKLSSGGLSQREQQVWEDINSIKQFLQAYPTQLTPYGLSAVHAALEPGEFAILFRNDHFSTIYKHPRDQQLYTLITDAGYADRDEIIWETLEDINGARSEFFSGDFNSVSHGDTRHAMPHSQTPAANPRRHSEQQTPHENFDGALAMDLQAQEQHDADFAMALQLQEEEEQAMRRRRNQQNQPSDQPGPPSGPGNRGTGNRGTGNGGPNQRPQQGRRPPGNIPIPLRGNRNPDSVENRPLIPPRNNQNYNPPAVNRPSDANDEDAPPAYEEAARTTPYVPPIGSPLHPSSSTDLSGRGGPSTSTTNVHAQGQTTGVTGSSTDRPGLGRMPGQFMPHRRRTSAYGENSENWQSHSPDYSAGAFGPSYAFMRSPDTERRPVGRGGPDRERDCIVM